MQLVFRKLSSGYFYLVGVLFEPSTYHWGMNLLARIGGKQIAGTHVQEVFSGWRSLCNQVYY
jgi:hypothetical protein